MKSNKPNALLPLYIPLHSPPSLHPFTFSPPSFHPLYIFSSLFTSPLHSPPSLHPFTFSPPSLRPLYIFSSLFTSPLHSLLPLNIPFTFSPPSLRPLYILSSLFTSPLYSLLPLYVPFIFSPPSLRPLNILSSLFTSPLHSLLHLYVPFTLGLLDFMQRCTERSAANLSSAWWLELVSDFRQRRPWLCHKASEYNESDWRAGGLSQSRFSRATHELWWWHS